MLNDGADEGWGGGVGWVLRLVGLLRLAQYKRNSTWQWNPLHQRLRQPSFLAPGISHDNRNLGEWSLHLGPHQILQRLRIPRPTLRRIQTRHRPVHSLQWPNHLRRIFLQQPYNLVEKYKFDHLLSQTKTE